MYTWAAVKADTYRQYGFFSPALLVIGFFTRRNFRVIITMRLCQVAAARGGLSKLILPTLKILHRAAAHTASMVFPWKGNFGAGLTIAHGWGIVVSEGAIIGKNVTLYHGVTLGRRDRIVSNGERQTGYPVIEDESRIGPHAIIVGQVTIGRCCRVGGSAFIADDIPPHLVVSGNPARVVKSGCTSDVWNPAPLLFQSSLRSV